MRHREWRFRIADMLDSISKIPSYIAELGFTEFEQDSRTIDTVLRNFEILGQAAQHVPPDIKKRHPTVPWREMQDFRNLAIHEYGSVDPQIVWQTAIKDLPALPHMLETILEQEPE